MPMRIPMRTLSLWVSLCLFYPIPMPIHMPIISFSFLFFLLYIQSSFAFLFLKATCLRAMYVCKVDGMDGWMDGWME